MSQEFQFDLDENALKIMKFTIIQEEKRNAKTHELSDSEMEKKICKIIEDEVARH